MDINVSTKNHHFGPESGRLENHVATMPRPSSTLESIVQAICLDAQNDSLKFVLRSNTGHDGE